MLHAIIAAPPTTCCGSLRLRACEVEHRWLYFGRSAGADMILRDHEGVTILTLGGIFAHAMIFWNRNVWSSRREFLLALQWSTLPFDVESDCLQAVVMVKSGDSNKSKHAFMVREINDSIWERKFLYYLYSSEQE